jgi:beta-glucosidase
VGQLPVFYNAKPSARRGYLFDTVAPLYPFGYGLSYTSFDLSGPRLSSTKIGVGGSVTVSVDVRNSGARAGDETVQLYIRDKVSSVTRPIKELKGFERISLQPGETRTVRFTVDPRRLEMWNDKMERVVEPGAFEIMTGANSVDLKSATLMVLP